MKIRYIMVLVSFFISGCVNSPNTKTNTCSNGRTLLDNICVKNEVADYVGCVRARGAELTTENSKLTSAEISYFGVGAGLTDKENNSSHKTYSSSANDILAIINQCNSITLSSDKGTNEKKVKYKSYAIGEAVLIWSNALYDSNLALAQKYTSKTSYEYIRNAFGSLKKLSQIFVNANNRPKCVLNNETANEYIAVVTYTCYYPDNSTKYWADTLFLEEGTWKVAPQFVRTAI